MEIQHDSIYECLKWSILQNQRVGCYCYEEEGIYGDLIQSSMQVALLCYILVIFWEDGGFGRIYLFYVYKWFFCINTYASCHIWYLEMSEDIRSSGNIVIDSVSHHLHSWNQAQDLCKHDKCSLSNPMMDLYQIFFIFTFTHTHTIL